MQPSLRIPGQNFIYLYPDARKADGSYMEIYQAYKSLLPHEKLRIMDTGTRIPVEDVVASKIV